MTRACIEFALFALLIAAIVCAAFGFLTATAYAADDWNLFTCQNDSACSGWNLFCAAERPSLASDPAAAEWNLFTRKRVEQTETSPPAAATDKPVAYAFCIPNCERCNKMYGDEPNLSVQLQPAGAVDSSLEGYGYPQILFPTKTGVYRRYYGWTTVEEFEREYRKYN